jgi:Xaa-Pro dipeptidase
LILLTVESFSGMLLLPMSLLDLPHDWRIAIMDSENSYPRFSDAEFARRYDAMRAAMAEAREYALIIYGTPGADAAVSYLSNFLVSREAVLIFPLTGEPTLFVQYFNHLPNARKVAAINDVRWGGPDMMAAVAENMHERRIEAARFGVVGALPWNYYNKLWPTLRGAIFEDFTPRFQQLRQIKSEEEIAFLRRGAEFSDLAIEALEREVRPGMREVELTAIVEGAYLGLGGRTHIHFMATTPMSNPSICVPAQYQTNRVIERGDVLITEISSQYHGYPGQILRPFAIGALPTDDYQRMFDVALETFTRITGVLRDGATADDVLDAAEYIHTSGYTICDDLLHGFGGGYLQPSLRTRRTSIRSPQPFTFRENMTVVIQPNIITEDQRMGLQLGELVRITRDGVESLHRYPRRFIRCG